MHELKTHDIDFRLNVEAIYPSSAIVFCGSADNIVDRVYMYTYFAVEIDSASSNQDPASAYRANATKALDLSDGVSHQMGDSLLCLG